MCHNEITIKPKGRDFMNYKEIVEKVMGLLKERRVCSSSRKSHKDCYEAFGGFMEKENLSYSPEVRDRCLELIRSELPRQRCTVWEQYLYQLEEMDLAGTVSDRRLYLNRSDYDKLPEPWKLKLDLYLEDCRPQYTEQTRELTRIYCSKVLLLFTDMGIIDINNVTYDTIFKLVEMKMYCTEETKTVLLNYTARMMRFWGIKKLCTENFSVLMNSPLYSHVGRASSFSHENYDVIQNVSSESLEFPAEEFRESIVPFIETLEKHGYVGTTLKLAKHALTALFLFLDIHSFGFHTDIMWAWFSENKRTIGSSWRHWRRILRFYEEYTLYGGIQPDGRFQYEMGVLDSLPVWCRQSIHGFLEQKRREFREDGTIRSYCYSCIRFCRFLLLNSHEGFERLSPADIKNFAGQDIHKTFSGRSSCFVIIRGFLRYLEENKYTRIPNLDLCLLAGTAPVEKIVDVLSDEQVRRVYEFRLNHRKAIELRDVAIVLLGIRMGFRASDVLNLRFRDIDWKKREISIVMKKTKTQITLPVPVDVGNAIYAYICTGRPKNGGELLFIRSKAPYGKLTAKVCTKALYRILPERKEMTGGGFHVTRRTFATNLLRNHAGINKVMDALGHRDPTSVMKYLLLDDERSRRCGISLEDAGIPMRGGLA